MLTYRTKIKKVQAQLYKGESFVQIGSFKLNNPGIPRGHYIVLDEIGISYMPREKFEEIYELDTQQNKNPEQG